MNETYRGLGTVLGSTVQERHRYSGASPEQGCENDEATGVFLIWGEAKSWGFLPCRREGFGGILSTCEPYPNEPK